MTPLMWMWPLDRAMGATTAHKAPGRMADGTCTWGLAWMIDKCRRKMNGRGEYITTEITRRKGGRPRRRGRPREGSYVAERSWGFLSSSEESLLLGTLGCPILCVYHPRNESSPYHIPTFGLTLYKFIVMDYGSKTVTLQYQ